MRIMSVIQFSINPFNQLHILSKLSSFIRANKRKRKKKLKHFSSATISLKIAIIIKEKILIIYRSSRHVDGNWQNSIAVGRLKVNTHKIACMHQLFYIPERRNSKDSSHCQQLLPSLRNLENIFDTF